MSNTTASWLIVFALFMAIASPLLVIWCLNTLFNLNIAYGFAEWFAALIILGIIRGDGIKFNKEKES